MKIGEILAKSRKGLSSYGIKYRQPYDVYYDLFLSNDEIKPIQINSILVLTDKRPRSLIAIAYALRLAKALKANLLAITKGVHQELIKGEAQIYDINLALLRTESKQISLEYILRIIQDYEVGLVVFHNLYEFSDALQESSPVPVMIIKINQFFKPTKELSGGYIT
ncbi:MAG: hypothetical protein ACFFDP_07920 [Promethearchaeota archaeon]